jgi:diguanylate cyclase (GGDEF)-like protein
VLSVLQEDRVVAVPKLSQALLLDPDPARLHSAQRSLGVADSWLTPLQRTGENWGLLLLLMPANPPASVAEAALLGRHTALALTNLREKETGRKQGELDTVRSVYDEQRFLEQLTQEIRRSQRHKRPLSVMLLQVQNLAELRARYGRFLTEQVLRHVGDLLAAAKRDTDFLGASSEDGFATILVEADQEGARRAKERLLTSLESAKLPNIDLPELHIELACATATLPEDGKTAEELAATAAARLSQQEPAQEDAA